jgi:hydroxypyruvate isomerase
MAFELSASLSALYPDQPLAAACRAARADGFSRVELWAPPARADWPEALNALSGLSVTSVNSDAGASPSFGTAGDPGRTAAWRAGFAETLEFTRASSAEAINVLAGGRLRDQTRDGQLATLRANLAWALATLQPNDPVLLLEPLNGADRHSPLLSRVDDAVRILDGVGSPQIRLLFDAYHVHQEEPDLLATYARVSPYVGHVQVADFPGRGEPGTGELPWEAFLAEVVSSGYRGSIGCEFLPTRSDAVSRARAVLQGSLVAVT